MLHCVQMLLSSRIYAIRRKIFIVVFIKYSRLALVGLMGWTEHTIAK